MPSGAPIGLLTTTGRRSGRARTTPLLFIWDDDDMIIIASNGGSSRFPHWYLNVLDDARVVVEVDDWRQDRLAEPIDEQDRPILWARLVDAYLHFEHYRERTDRDLPILRLRASGPHRAKRDDPHQ